MGLGKKLNWRPKFRVLATEMGLIEKDVDQKKMSGHYG